MTTQHRWLCRVTCVLLCSSVACQASSCDIGQWGSAIAEAAASQHVQGALIEAVMQVESDACQRIDGRLTTSATGAMGLMQILPSTWDTYRSRLGLSQEPYIPHDNILAGAAYLHDLIRDLGVLDGIAAYFAGPEAIRGRRKDGGLPSPATLDYVRRVLIVLAQKTAAPLIGGTGGTKESTSLFALDRAADRRQVDGHSNSSLALFAIIHRHEIDRTTVPEPTLDKR